MTETHHLFNSLLRIAARPIHHNAAIPIETRSGVRCRGRTDPDVHLADPVSNGADKRALSRIQLLNGFADVRENVDEVMLAIKNDDVLM